MLPLFAYVECRRPEQQQELGPSAVLGDILHPETYEGELAGSTHLVM